jgi:DNA-binding CsgD family transcriptional regulator
MNEAAVAQQADVAQYTQEWVKMWGRMRTSELSDLEMKELQLIARGYGNEASAMEQSLSLEAIRTRRSRMYPKLRVRGAQHILELMLADAVNDLARKTM